MRRIKLEVAYDEPLLWLANPTGKPTVEAEINQALTKLLKEEIKVIGASRTDSGVHALGNVAVFDTERMIPAEKICFALNQWLPEDIRVQNSIEVPSDFHPRKVACRKTYEYRILNSRIAIPTERLYANFIYYDMDIEKMQEAANDLIGEHDFKSFCSVKTQVLDTVRTIYKLEVHKNGDIITIRKWQWFSIIWFDYCRHLT